MNIHRLEEDGGGGDKFEWPKPLHFKKKACEVLQGGF